MNKKLKIFPLLGLLVLSSCAPTVIVVDRATLMEEEALGPWPELQEELASEVLKDGPLVLPHAGQEKKRARLHNVLPAPVGTTP